MTKHERLKLAAALLLTLASAFACAGRSATAAAPGADAPGKRPGVECRTVLEIRPGPYGTSGGATPVQKCEPADVPPPTLGGTPTPSDDDAPLGSPLPPPGR